MSVIPIITSRKLFKLSPLQKPLQSWVESLNQIPVNKVGIVDLHPNIFSVNPRCAPTRVELPGSTKKPWPQKGLGKARQGTIRAPQFRRGGIVHGPRGPKSFFFMEPFFQRILGLRTALTVKFHQNDLHIVDSLEIPVSDPTYLEKLIEERYWGPSVLFVDDTQYMPFNITAAADKIRGVTLMPTMGLNVYSMLKHNSLVITLKSLEKIEERLLYFMNNTQHIHYKTTR